MTCDLEYVTLKHIFSPVEVTISGRVDLAYQYVFVNEEFGFKQIFPVIRIGNNKHLDVGKEYHVTCKISSFPKHDKKTKYKYKKNKYGNVLDTEIVLIYTGCIEL